MLKKLFWQLVNISYKYIAAPRMISGYKSDNGDYLPNVRIGSTVALIGKERLYLHDNVWIGHYCFIEASNKITIGEGCQITNYVSLVSHSSYQSMRLYGKHYLKHSPNLLAYKTGAIEIGKYTFIAPHCLILPNTKIGKGCLIKAYSQLKGEYPDFAVIAGNPAQVIGDTRDADKKYLEQYPELSEYYQEWILDD